MRHPLVTILVLSTLALGGAAAGGSKGWPDLPRDHAGHPDAPLEWWVFAGHVERPDGRWYAYQVAFHRFDVDTAVAPDTDHRWVFRSIYPAAIGLTDLSTGRFYSRTSVDRSGAGTAHAPSDTPDLRYRAWHAWLDGDAWVIDAPADSFRVSLRLVPAKPVVAFGVDGVLTASDAGTLARRYALPRLETTGTVAAQADTFQVTGISWMDHVYGRQTLLSGEAGWDVANVQLRDGAELSVYRFRSEPGRRERRIGGAYISASGVVMRLESLTTRFYPVGSNRWVSPRTEQSYPVRWRVEIPALSIRLDLACVPRHQELAAFRTHGAGIWRGSVEVTGTRGDAQITGAGFMEMVGYAGRFPPDVAEAAR